MSDMNIMAECGLDTEAIEEVSEKTVIDKFTRDQLLTSSFDPEAKKRAETNTSPKPERVNQQIVSGKALAAGEDNKDEIEAISILYSRPYAAGLRTAKSKSWPAVCRSSHFTSTNPSRKLCCDFGRESQFAIVTTPL